MNYVQAAQPRLLHQSCSSVLADNHLELSSIISGLQIKASHHYLIPPLKGKAPLSL